MVPPCTVSMHCIMYVWCVYFTCLRANNEGRGLSMNYPTINKLYGQDTVIGEFVGNSTSWMTMLSILKKV